MDGWVAGWMDEWMDVSMHACLDVLCSFPTFGGLPSLSFCFCFSASYLTSPMLHHSPSNDTSEWCLLLVVLCCMGNLFYSNDDAASV